MDSTAVSRLLNPAGAFDSEATRAIVGVIVGVLLVSGISIFALTKAGKVSGPKGENLVSRYKSWLFLVPMLLVPILAGPAATILLFTVLALLAHREFARATGLFRDHKTSALVVLGILTINFAALDNWFNLFLTVFPLGVGLIAASNVLRDEPDGYLQRVALGAFSLGLFGSGLGHISMMTCDQDYRPIVLWLIVVVQMGDVLAYVCGNLFGRNKLLPITSPGKTIGGAVGSLVLTGILGGWLGRYVFQWPDFGWTHCLVLSLLVAALGQLGDLVVSSIKRDAGVKDMGTVFPGHGGILDRFDSLLLAAPAAFHYLNYFHGLGNGASICILTGAR